MLFPGAQIRPICPVPHVAAAAAAARHRCCRTLRWRPVRAPADQTAAHVQPLMRRLLLTTAAA